MRDLTEEVCGSLWLVMWLFTWGFANLGWGWGLISFVLWPFFLGSALSR